MNRYLSSEFVGCGHPDKVADQISDSMLDLFLSQDKNSRVAVETLVSGNKIILAGEISSHAQISIDDMKQEVLKTIEGIGYGPDIPCQFRSDNVDVEIYIKPQSPNIHSGVDKENGDVGAGDQGIMFGFATKETSDFLLPLPYVVAGDILTTLNWKILNGFLPGIFTDNKSQVCCLYENGNIEIKKIILSSFHDKHIDITEVRRILYDSVLEEIFEKYSRHISRKEEIEIFINSAGPFWVGGPEADAGVTGRKIIVDTYGGFAPHGGGAFSGKDPSKVDRSAAYMARHIAKSFVASGHGREALVQLSYAIGSVQPFSISVKSDSIASEEFLVKKVKETFDLSPRGIIEYLKLNDPNVVKYKKIASGGHFLVKDAPWEKIKEI